MSSLCLAWHLLFFEKVAYFILFTLTKSHKRAIIQNIFRSILAKKG
nr:MAG TPA: hypothetical protein [Caudoviricetes sp.]